MAITNETAYWKRVGYVAIEDRSGRMRAYGGENGGLDFRFDGQFVGDLCPKFTVGILGLSTDTIQDLTTWNIAESVKKGRKVEVYAGYEKDGLATPLMKGIIIEAYPTNPPEMWLNLTCMMSKDASAPVEKSERFKGKVRELLKEIARRMGKTSRWDAEKEIGDKDTVSIIGGNPTKMAERFASRYGVIVYEDNGILVSKPKREWLTGAAKMAEPLSMETGLLGLGNVTMAGATVKRRLDNTARLLSWIKLTSKIVPKANGYYYVISKRHVGHFRGNDWYTELKLLRKAN